MDDRLKKTLRAISLETRHILEGQNGEAGDLEKQLNRLGIWRNRSKPIEEMPHLSTEDREARRVVDAYLDFRQEADVARKDAVTEFIRESAYTWANRLFALRIMEARGIIDEVILKKEVYGGRSLVHNRFAKKNPEACRGEDDGLFIVLFNEFQERSKDLPDVFNPESPATKLRPSVAALKRVLALLSGLEQPRGQESVTDEVFEAPDIFGWMYQYWNSEEKDKIFEKVKNEKAKIEGLDIIPATQLYTETYMVKFLVQNSLGAIWMGMHPESKLFDRWAYYVQNADRAPVKSKFVSEISFMDPASGSGHFHLDAFDLFFEMYQEEGIIKEPTDICVSILNKNLFGIDIDERAVQISKAVLWMKAIDRAPNLEGSQLKEFHDHFIATNIRLPKSKDQLEDFLKKHPDDEPLKPALEAIFNGLENVAELGSLVQIEEPVEKELKSLKSKGSIFLFGKDVGWDVWKRSISSRLREHFITEAKVADLGQSFFNSSANQALKLFDLLSQQYDVLATNPPYMGKRRMGGILKSFLAANYKESKEDLYSAFIERCFSLCSYKGYVSMVNMYGYMFIGSFSGLRNLLINRYSITILNHVGTYAFPEMRDHVNAVLNIFQNFAPDKSHLVTAFRLEGVFPKADSLIDETYRYDFHQESLNKVQGKPFIYWLSDSILDIFSLFEPLSTYFDVKLGLSAVQNSRVYRMYWETGNEDSSNWCKLMKGGQYDCWLGPEHWQVNYREDGFYIKQLVREKYPYLKGNYSWKVRDEDYYFRPGCTYTNASAWGIGLRRMDKDSIFEDTSPAIFLKSSNSKLSERTIMGIANSRVTKLLTNVLNPTVHLQSGDTQKIPICIPPSNILMDKLVNNCINCKEYLLSKNPNSFYYSYNLYNSNSLRDIILKSTELAFSYSVFLSLSEGWIDRLVFDYYDISDPDITTFLNETSIPVAWLPFIEGHNVVPENINGLDYPPGDLLNFLKSSECLKMPPAKLDGLKKQLSILYSSGPGANQEIDEYEENIESGDDRDLANGVHVPTPIETFLEEMAQKLRINPVTICSLIKEGIKNESWRCLQEELRIIEDIFSVIVLRLLGYRWPKQIEAGEPLPYWADDKDGIISLTEGCGEKNLLERVRELIAEEFTGAKWQDIEREFEEIMGISLEKWLAGPFFKHHISQFKKRPIAWQIESKPPNGVGRGRKARQTPVFSCLVYYHKLNRDLLHKIRTQYVWNLRDRFETETRTLENTASPSNDQLERLGTLRRWIEELKDFDAKLEEVSLNGFDCTKLKEIIDQEPLDKWTSRDGQAAPPATKEEFFLQEKRYDPDINDGVRVNVAPLQIAGLLSADVLAKKDPEKAIQDRAEWRADERRWCRQGKLPRPGWWKVDGQ